MSARVAGVAVVCNTGANRERLKALVGGVSCVLRTGAKGDVVNDFVPGIGRTTKVIVGAKVAVDKLLAPVINAD
jgi:hypothetical protein